MLLRVSVLMITACLSWPLALLMQENIERKVDHVINLNVNIFKHAAIEFAPR